MSLFQLVESHQSWNSSSQNQTNVKTEFIKVFAPYAQKLERKYHVLPSITIAQAALESDWGRSDLAAIYNNFYGVKASEAQSGVVLNTKEFYNGEYKVVSGRFRVYHSWKASMLDHSKLLSYGTRDKPNRYRSVINATSFQQAAYALKIDGYATDPNYPIKLIRLIKEYHLNRYDY